MQGERRPGRIVVISATIGGGHDAAAGELARRLGRRGYEVVRHDFIDLLPMRLGRRAKEGHHRLISRTPWLYALLFGIGERYRTTPHLTRLMLYPVRRRLMRVVGPDVKAVVSTYPLACQVIGPLRQSGRLTSTAITYTTDFGVHRHWVAPGVDVQLTSHAVAAEQARQHGARSALVAGALVREGFRPAPPGRKELARQRLGLPPGRLALVVSGSWGVGEIEATAADIAATGVATPVVICGHNAELRERLVRQGVPYALGWVDDMPTLMQAVDVMVENAGGVMALEGMACGLPVITYRQIPGHGTRSARTLAEAGVATWVRRREGLAQALMEVADGPRGQRQRRAAGELFMSDAAECIADLIDAPIPAPPRRARALARVAAAVALVLTVTAMRTRRRRPPPS
jgi:UDP-N-acetylglucosamine:LPS N-acetylglucosamine transferase